MRGRFTQHFDITLPIRNIELDLVCEGVMDIDEGYFEIDDIYLQHGRDKIKGYKTCNLTPRVKKYILRNFDTDITEKAWSEL